MWENTEHAKDGWSQQIKLLHQIPQNIKRKHRQDTICSRVSHWCKYNQWFHTNSKLPVANYKSRIVGRKLHGEKRTYSDSRRRCIDPRHPLPNSLFPPPLSYLLTRLSVPRAKDRLYNDLPFLMPGFSFLGTRAKGAVYLALLAAYPWLVNAETRFDFPF